MVLFCDLCTEEQKRMMQLYVTLLLKHAVPNKDINKSSRRINQVVQNKENTSHRGLSSKRREHFFRCCFLFNMT